MFSHGVTIVTTTWNERQNIEKFVSSVRSVLQNTPHEIIVVDDGSSDGTFQVAKLVADLALTKRREGQTKGLLFGMQHAKHPVIVTIDSDLENDPKHIPMLVDQLTGVDVVVASRTKLPRTSEKIASNTLGRIVGVTDVFSNYRGFRKEAVSGFKLQGGETFGAEFLVIAKKRGLKIGEIKYNPPPRRKHPRVGGTVTANLRILWALVKSLVLCLV